MIRKIEIEQDILAPPGNLPLAQIDKGMLQTGLNDLAMYIAAYVPKTTSHLGRKDYVNTAAAYMRAGLDEHLKSEVARQQIGGKSDEAGLGLVSKFVRRR